MNTSTDLQLYTGYMDIFTCNDLQLYTVYMDIFTCNDLQLYTVYMDIFTCNDLQLYTGYWIYLLVMTDSGTEVLPSCTSSMFLSDKVNLSAQTSVGKR